MSKKTALSRKPWSAILILIAFILALLCCTGILRSILWKNTNAMGLSLVKNYSSAEEQNINACEAVLDICAEYIAAREQTDISPAELRGDVSPFLTGLTDRYGRDKLRAYGGIRAGGSLLPIPSGSAGRAAAAANRQDWYQASADGETYLSPVYTSGASGQPVVTMCRRIPETGSFLAIDLHPAYFDVSYSDVELPEQSVYFLVDQSGTLVYALSSWQSEREELQALANDCGTNTSCELSNHVLENVKVSDGIVRNVYYHHMANGWTGILTIPKNAILSGSNMFRNISLALIGFGAVLILLQLFQEYRNGQREREHLVYQSAMNSTVRACRAIYYVDVKKRPATRSTRLGRMGNPATAPMKRK